MKLYRADGIIDLQRTQQQKIVLIGCGSLGSLAISNLALPWKEIVLIDPDNFEVENVERHLLGKRGNLNKPKAEGVKRWLVDHNVPSRRITVHVDFAENVLDQHTDADLILAAVDKRHARDIINRWAHDNYKPVFYGGIYPKGTGGQVMVIPNPQQACYQCAEQMMGGAKEEVHSPADYGVDISQLRNDDGDLTGVPCLRAPIQAVGAYMANLAKEYLSTGEIKSQVFVMAFDTWQDVMVLDPRHPFVTAARRFIDVGEKTMIVPNRQLVVNDGDEEAIYGIRNGMEPLELVRWNQCPLHQAAVSLEDI